MKKINGYLIGSNLKTKHSYEIYTEISNNSINYCNKQIKSEKDFASFILKKKYDFCNITAPYKKIIREFLDFESDLVKKTGVCNLVINKNGILAGYNTDVSGFNMLLSINGIDLKNKKVLILGNGATAKTIKYVVEQRGASYIEIGCRKKREEFNNEKLFNEVSRDANIIINATPLGSNESDKKLVDLKEYKELEFFIDVVSKPYRTPTMIDAIELEKGAIGGYDMLFFQARQAYELITKTMYPSFIWLSLRKELLMKHVNIVLTGLPTAGKTKIGKEMSEKFNTEKGSYFFDTDELCEKVSDMSISDIFETYGEKEFREIEKQVVKQIKNFEGIIISTGGGTIIDYNNYRSLAKNGYIVYLKKTNFDDYIDDGKRPLAKTKEDMDSLFIKRNPIYEKRSNLTVKSDITIKDLIEEVFDAIVGY